MVLGILLTLLYAVFGAGVQKSLLRIPTHEGQDIGTDTMTLLFWPFILVGMAFNPDGLVGEIEEPHIEDTE